MQLFLNKFDFLDASGGTKLQPGNGYIYHVFLSPGDLTFTKAFTPVTVDYLVIAGGGGGGGMFQFPPGSYASGGGGAGGVLSGIVTATEGDTYTISVGSGGAGGSSSPATAGVNGIPSYVLGPVGFSSITSFGGGGGGAGINPPQPPATNGVPGGSGGGGGANARPRGNGTPGQGNPGGQAFFTGNTTTGGGGGSGGSGSSNTNGGIAAQYPQFPGPVIAPAIPSPVRPGWTPVIGSGYYASGGNGGSNSSGFTITGGAGANYPWNRNAVQYTGAGGGGCRGGIPALGLPGGSGGDGIVIFRYPA